MNLFNKTLAAGAAALTLALAFAPAAEARGGRHGGGWGHHGHHGGGWGRPGHGGGWGHHRPWRAPVFVGVVGGGGYGGCIRYRQFYNPYLGTYVTRRVNICR